MTVETALYPSQFNTNWPTAADMVSEGDNHLRLIKTVDKTTWPNIAGAVTASHIELNYLVGVTSGIQAQLNAKGAIAGQTWTGAHVYSGSIAVPTLTQGTSTTGAASTAFVQNEWSTRLPNYSAPITASSTELNYVAGVTSAIQTQLNTKGAIAGQTWTGTHVFPSTTTVGPLTPTIQGYLSTVTSDAQAQINAKGAITGQTWSGSHDFTAGTITVPTQSIGDNSTKAASTAFVAAAAFSSALPGQSGNSGKFVTTNGSSASWAFPTLTMVLITSTTPVTAAPGNFYIFTVSGAQLNVPTTFNAGDPFGFGVSRGVTSATVDWSTNKVRGRSPGVMTLLTQNDSAVCVYANATDGFMEAA